MNSEARKAKNRERMRELRLDPAFRAKELESNKQYRERNREKVNAATNKWRNKKYQSNAGFRLSQKLKAIEAYHNVREQLFNGYGNQCSCCGESERAFLELDHVNGGGNKHFASHKSPVNLYREVIKAGFPSIYRLLCANCNRGRQRNLGTCPHQNGGLS